jgi:predicted trehalose synthase
MSAAPDDLGRLATWLAGQRWFAASTTGQAPVVRSLERAPLPTVPPVTIGLVEMSDGDRYQLLLPAPAGVAAKRPKSPSSTRNAEEPDAEEPDAPLELGKDTEAIDALGRFVACNATSSPGPDGAVVVGHWLDDEARLGDGATRLLGVEQSNTSAVVGGTHVLKAFRRVQAGPHPELEVGRHLATVADTHPAPVARLAGWYEVSPGGPDSESTVLGVVQELVAGAADGWALVLSGLAADPTRLLGRLHDLGVAVAELHDALAQPAAPTASTAADAPEAFGRVPLDAARVDEVAATTADAAARLLATVPEQTPGTDALGERAGEVAGLAEALAAAVGSDRGSAIRHHGDLHLGQTVVGAEGWVILDFEGEPARPLEERRRRHSPLRDAAGMLRSFAYAAATHRRSAGRHLPVGWEPAARAAFLDGYLAAVDPELLPTSPVATRRLLELFELEKLVYELGYEAAHRPDWLPIPLAGLQALLGETPA